MLCLYSNDFIQAQINMTHLFHLHDNDDWVPI